MGSCRQAARIALAIASAAYSGGRSHGGGVRFDGQIVNFDGLHARPTDAGHTHGKPR